MIFEHTLQAAAWPIHYYGRKDMTTCSKYLEGSVTGGGVLGAEGLKFRQKRRRVNQGGELQRELCRLKKNLLQDRVKV